jgi:WD40 repeat protein
MLSTIKHKHTWKRSKGEDTLVLASGHPSGRIKLWNCETGKSIIMSDDPLKAL